jgi:hypothetical protein
MAGTSLDEPGHDDVDLIRICLRPVDKSGVGRILPALPPVRPQCMAIVDTIRKQEFVSRAEQCVPGSDCIIIIRNSAVDR